ncbi:unnamed protein product [Penicillium glandicola]
MKLERWTKHSDGKIHWWDRVRVGLFAEATVEALSEQLNSCKSTMNAAVSTSALTSTTKVSSTAAAMEKVLQAKEVDLSQKMVEINEQNVVAGMILKKATEIQLSGDQDRSEFIEQLQDQRATLDDSRKLLEDLLKEAHQVRTGQKIINDNMSDGGKLPVGIINCEYANGEIHQEIHYVKATNHGRGVVGMIKDFDVNTFLND